MQKKSSQQYAIVLAGGSGTRLWPLSRALMPKQLIPLDGDKSLLQKTVQRLLKKLPAQNIFTVTHADHRFEVIGQLHDIHPDLVGNVLAEPVAKNTLPAVAWATFHISKSAPQACIGVFSSDQHIRDEAAFLNAWTTAERSSASGNIVLIGLKPTEAATGYGYIQAGEASATGWHQVLRFVEKPDKVTAEKYLKDGNYLWNGGMFIYQAETFLQLLKTHQSEIHALADEIASQKKCEANPRLYERFPNISIDCGLIEKASELAVVPADMGWSDLGSWDALHENLKQNVRTNVTRGEVVAVESENNMLWSENALLAVYNVSGLAVIQTRDATLVCPLNKTGELKSLIKVLSEKHPQALQSNMTGHRPWGKYTIIENHDQYKIKHIVVKPRQELSLQRHAHRSEHWVVVKGEARVTNGDKEFTLKTNESTFIPKGSVHRLQNSTDQVLEIIEVQIGNYLGEDDIERLEDKYGRTE